MTILLDFFNILWILLVMMFLVSISSNHSEAFGLRFIICSSNELHHLCMRLCYFSPTLCTIPHYGYTIVVSPSVAGGNTGGLGFEDIVPLLLMNNWCASCLVLTKHFHVIRMLWVKSVWLMTFSHLPFLSSVNLLPVLGPNALCKYVLLLYIYFIQLH